MVMLRDNYQLNELNAKVESLLNEEISRIGNNYMLELLCYNSYCDRCNSSELWKAGMRRNKRKGNVQRYRCRRCGSYSSDDFLKCSHMPSWVLDCVLFGVCIGLPYKLIPMIVCRESEHRTGETFHISVPTVYSIVQKAISILNAFELDVRRYFVPQGKILSAEWQVDERYHNWKKNVEREKEIIQMKFGIDLSLVETIIYERKTRWEYLYPLCVVEKDICYGLSIFVSRHRNEEAMRKALQLAIVRSTYKPLIVKVEEYRPFINAVEKELPGTKVIHA